MISNKISETDKITMMKMEKKKDRKIGVIKIEIKITRNKKKRTINANKDNTLTKTGTKGHNKMVNKWELKSTWRDKERTLTYLMQKETNWTKMIWE